MDNKLFIQFAKRVLKLSEITIDDKTYYIEGDLAVGVEVLDENGEHIADGDYQVNDTKITVKDGVIESVEEVQEPEPEPELIKQEAEPEPAAEPQKDEKDIKIEELEGLLRDRDAVIEELTQKIKELEDKKEAPLEDPIKMNKVGTNNGETKGALKYFQK